MNYSIFWARFIGICTVILSTGFFFNSKNYQSLILDMMSHHYIVMLMGLINLLLGVAIIVTHPVWRNWAVIITILGYWITIRGCILLFFPHWIVILFFAPLPAFFVGVILLYCGFFLYRKS